MTIKAPIKPRETLDKIQRQILEMEKDMEVKRQQLDMLNAQNERKEALLGIYRRFIARYEKVSARHRKLEKELDAVYDATIKLLRGNLSTPSISEYRDSIPSIAPTIIKRSQISKTLTNGVFLMGAFMTPPLMLGALIIGMGVFSSLIGFALAPVLVSMLIGVGITVAVLGVIALSLMLASLIYNDSRELMDSTKKMADVLDDINGLDPASTSSLHDAIHEEFSAPKESSDAEPTPRLANSATEGAPASAPLRFFPPAPINDKDSNTGPYPSLYPKL